MTGKRRKRGGSILKASAFAMVQQSSTPHRMVSPVTCAMPVSYTHLGANEAPPAIVSMFLGEELEGVLDAIESGAAYDAREHVQMKIGVHVLPRFPKDTTDRNRTSPFAFTGNKFEFRMPGSSVSISDANVVINTAVAESLKQYADILEAASDFKAALHDLIRGTIKKHKRIIFSGNGYDDAWICLLYTSVLPINNADKITLSDLIGYELQKRELVANTEAFVHGRSANNVLLYGDSGTGKSSSVKAVLNEYAGEGLRMIELYKHQFRDLSTVIAAVKNRNYRFILFIDDLSFEEHEVEYKFLKAVIEGGVEKMCIRDRSASARTTACLASTPESMRLNPT